MDRLNTGVAPLQALAKWTEAREALGQEVDDPSCRLPQPPVAMTLERTPRPRSVHLHPATPTYPISDLLLSKSPYQLALLLSWHYRLCRLARRCLALTKIASIFR